MKKVFIVHGFKGSPNTGWVPWFMRELDKLGIWACSLPMPTPKHPKCQEWIDAIAKNITETNDDTILVGYSLGSAAILKFLEQNKHAPKFGNVFLIAGPCNKLETGSPESIIRRTDNFFDNELDFETIKTKSKKFTIIHGVNDERVPVSHAQKITAGLDCKLVAVNNAGHFNALVEFPLLLEEFNNQHSLP